MMPILMMPILMPGRRVISWLMIPVLITSLLMAGCATNHPAQPEVPELPLLPPSGLGESLLIKQAVSMLWRGRQQQLLVVSELRPETIKLVALSPLGQRLLTVEYDGVTLQQHSAFPDLDLPARQMLAQMQFSLWPEAVVQTYLRQVDGWGLVASPQERTAYYKQQPILDIRYEGTGMVLHHRMLDYYVTVETLDKQSLLKESL